MWRQNSGKLFKEGRWVHFTDKNGLPDITLIYKGVYIGLELKLPKGRLTKYQQVTLPELSYNGIQYFIIQNVIDLFEVLEKLIYPFVLIGCADFHRINSYSLT